MSRGFLIFAHNTPDIDYVHLAICCASTIKRNSVVPNITLVSDKETIEYMNDQYPDYCHLFENVIIQKDDAFRNGRKEMIYDTRNRPVLTDWHIVDRVMAYDLSPYDETILIDADVLVGDSKIDACWGSDENYLFPRPVRLLNYTHEDHERFISPYGILRERTTILYFRKSHETSLLFQLAAHVSDHIDFYQFSYGITDAYRNDIGFSIGSHMLNGFKTLPEEQRLPFSFITCGGFNELFDVVGDNEFLFLMNDDADTASFNLNRVKAITVHIRNPMSILRHADKIIGGFRE
jgi:hypothetical protein